MARRSSTGLEEASRDTLPLWPPPRHGWVVLTSVAMLFAAHWFYGALVADASMCLNLAAAAILGAILATPRLRDDLLRLKGLVAPGLLLLLVLAVAAWTLAPWAPGGAHPIWAYVHVSPGATTIDKSSTLLEIFKLLGLACIFAIGLAVGARDDRARYGIQLTIAGGVLFGLWAFLASVTGAIYQSQGHRLEAHFLNPNTAGTFFAILLVLALAELVRVARRHRRDRASRALPLAAACLVFAVCLLDTASRGAAIAMLASLIVFGGVQLATGALKPTRALWGALAGMVLLLVLAALAGEQLIDRLFQSHEASVTRTEIWRWHWRAFLDSPLLGYGLGSAETVNKSLLSLSNVDVLWNIRAILNVYLQWLEEAGIVGAVPMFLCIGAVIFATARGAIRRQRMRGLLAALLAVDALVLIHGATDFGLEVPSLAALWAWLLGIQFSLAQGSSQR